MDEEYLFHTVRYVELNPVAARLVREPALWRWSSAGAHLLGLDDEAVCVKPMLDRVADWSGYLAQKSDKGVKESIRTHIRSGRPAGSERFLDRLEANTGRCLKRQKPGPKPRDG